MKLNAYCNEFESNKANFRMCLAQRKIRQGQKKKKKKKTKKKIWEAVMEIAGLNKQKTVARVG